MLDARHATQTPEQFILREEAAASNPEFATFEGRAMQDVRDTLACLALGMRPKTVLGGLIVNQFGPYDSTLVDSNGRHAIEVGVRGSVQPHTPNERGDTVQDVLEGLVLLGLVERTFDPRSVDAEMVPDDDHRKQMDVPFYRLSTQGLPAEVQETIGRIRLEQATDDVYEAEREARREQKAERKAKRTGIFRRIK